MIGEVSGHILPIVGVGGAFASGMDAVVDAEEMMAFEEQPVPEPEPNGSPGCGATAVGLGSATVLGLFAVGAMAALARRRVTRLVGQRQLRGESDPRVRQAFEQELRREQLRRQEIVQRTVANQMQAFDGYVPNNCLGSVCGFIRHLSHVFDGAQNQHVGRDWRILIVRPIGRSRLDQRNTIFIRDTRPEVHFVLNIGRRIYDFDSAGRPGEDVAIWLAQTFPNQRVGLTGMTLEYALGHLGDSVLDGQWRTLSFVDSEEFLSTYNAAYPDRVASYSELQPRGELAFATMYTITREICHKRRTWMAVIQGLRLQLERSRRSTKDHTLFVTLAFEGENDLASLSKLRRDYFRRELRKIKRDFGLQDIVIREANVQDRATHSPGAGQ